MYRVCFGEEWAIGFKLIFLLSIVDCTNTCFFGLFAVQEESLLDELRQAACFMPAIFVRSRDRMVGHITHASGQLSLCTYNMYMYLLLYLSLCIYIQHIHVFTAYMKNQVPVAKESAKLWTCMYMYIVHIQ